MKHIMLDLETLGTSYNSVVTQVALIEFDIHKQFDINEDINVYSANIDIQEQINNGSVIDGDTIKWWLNNNPEVLKSTLIDTKSINEVTNDITQFINNLCDKRDLNIWSHASFDIPILNNLLKIGNQPSVYYRSVRDLRTINMLVDPDMKLGYPRNDHNAIKDCLNQIEYYVNLFNKIKIE